MRKIWIILFLVVLCRLIAAQEESHGNIYVCLGYAHPTGYNDFASYYHNTLNPGFGYNIIFSDYFSFGFDFQRTKFSMRYNSYLQNNYSFLIDSVDLKSGDLRQANFGINLYLSTPWKSFIEGYVFLKPAVSYIRMNAIKHTSQFSGPPIIENEASETTFQFIAGVGMNFHLRKETGIFLECLANSAKPGIISISPLNYFMARGGLFIKIY